MKLQYGPMLLIGALLAATGCEDYVQRISSGDYHAVTVEGEPGTELADEYEILNTLMTIDRATATIAFVLDDGSTIVSSIGFRQFGDYCTMRSCSQLEAIEIHSYPLTIGSLSFAEPFLRPEMDVILRSGDVYDDDFPAITFSRFE